jgi:hypothetical protein
LAKTTSIVIQIESKGYNKVDLKTRPMDTVSKNCSIESEKPELTFTSKMRANLNLARKFPEE